MSEERIEELEGRIIDIGSRVSELFAEQFELKAELDQLLRRDILDRVEETIGAVSWSYEVNWYKDSLMALTGQMTLIAETPAYEPKELFDLTTAHHDVVPLGDGVELRFDDGVLRLRLDSPATGAKYIQEWGLDVDATQLDDLCIKLEEGYRVSSNLLNELMKKGATLDDQ